MEYTECQTSSRSFLPVFCAPWRIPNLPPFIVFSSLCTMKNTKLAIIHCLSCLADHGRRPYIAVSHSTRDLESSNLKAIFFPIWDPHALVDLCTVSPTPHSPTRYLAYKWQSLDSSSHSSTDSERFSFASTDFDPWRPKTTNRDQVKYNDLLFSDSMFCLPVNHTL